MKGLYSSPLNELSHSEEFYGTFKINLYPNVPTVVQEARNKFGHCAKEFLHIEDYIIFRTLSTLNTI